MVRRVNSGMNLSGRGLSCCSGRDGIESPARKWMAAQQSPGGETRAAQRTVYGDGLCCVIRTSGEKFAATWMQRVQRGREPAFIEAEQCKQEACHGAGSTGAVEVECFAERAASDAAC
jgi:hypothetical protein